MSFVILELYVKYFLPCSIPASLYKKPAARFWKYKSQENSKISILVMNYDVEYQLHAVSRVLQGRQREPSVKTSRSPLSSEFWRHCMLSPKMINCPKFHYNNLNFAKIFNKFIYYFRPCVLMLIRVKNIGII